MAAGDNYLECNTAGKKVTVDSDLAEILNALLVKDASGNMGFRTVSRAVSAGSITPFLACGAPLIDPVDVLRRALVETASGELAIGLITEA